MLTIVAQAQGRSGIYEVRGEEVSADGTKKTKYAGILIMKKISDKNHYIGQWTSVIGNNVVGFGYVNGSGQLVFAWNTGKVQGITEYKLGDGDKPYVGRWSQINDPRWHPETITFKCALPKADKEDDENEKD